MNAPAAPALADALRQAVLAQRFDTTPDRLRDGAPVEAFPSIDLAVVRFARGGRPARAANVLFSREHPGGVVARFGPAGGGLGPGGTGGGLVDGHGGAGPGGQGVEGETAEVTDHGG